MHPASVTVKLTDKDGNSAEVTVNLVPMRVADVAADYMPLVESSAMRLLANVSREARRSLHLKLNEDAQV